MDGQVDDRGGQGEGKRKRKQENETKRTRLVQHVPATGRTRRLLEEQIANVSLQRPNVVPLYLSAIFGKFRAFS